MVVAHCSGLNGGLQVLVGLFGKGDKFITLIGGDYLIGVNKSLVVNSFVPHISDVVKAVVREILYGCYVSGRNNNVAVIQQLVFGFVGVVLGDIYLDFAVGGKPSGGCGVVKADDFSDI